MPEDCNFNFHCHKTLYLVTHVTAPAPKLAEQHFYYCELYLGSSWIKDQTDNCQTFGFPQSFQLNCSVQSLTKRFPPHK